MREDEIKMWRKYKRTKSPHLREEIVKKYLYLVKYVAGRVAISLPPNVEFNDLVSYGILGLFDAINKYDVSQGNKFETYAVSRIRGSIMDELRKLDWAPRLLRKKAREVDRMCKELEEKNGRLATDHELADALSHFVGDDVGADQLLALVGPIGVQKLDGRCRSTFGTRSRRACHSVRFSPGAGALTR